tara:strand:- start:170 stop:400 length:231 start_codon:yes stop_codon:yes gene_type:complete
VVIKVKGNKMNMKMKSKSYSKGYAAGGMKPVSDMSYMNMGGMPKKDAYAKGGKVAMYNQGGMIKNTGSLNTGIKKA